MSINPQNYLLALILWHLIFCYMLMLQASPLKGLWILAESGFSSKPSFPLNMFELNFGPGSQEKIASRKSLSKVTGKTHKWPRNNSARQTKLSSGASMQIAFCLQLLCFHKQLWNSKRKEGICFLCALF